ncbi:hypothetical protein QET93_001575 [Akkermansia sp. N21116]|uniref:hypothetical protein n=1 Tax=Akkermansia sp. N21116 TaxID=3040764 RepID=UPI00244EFC35|nr:hypothetical protein [Akkermansia sp. N21116]WPX40793.1 hypothetical protein QET93_001575 [Akkermansia sp. N21116]
MINWDSGNLTRLPGIKIFMKKTTIYTLIVFFYMVNYLYANSFSYRNWFLESNDIIRGRLSEERPELIINSISKENGDQKYIVSYFVNNECINELFYFLPKNRIIQENCYSLLYFENGQWIDDSPVYNSCSLISLYPLFPGEKRYIKFIYDPKKIKKNFLYRLGYCGSYSKPFIFSELNQYLEKNNSNEIEIKVKDYFYLNEKFIVIIEISNGTKEIIHSRYLSKIQYLNIKKTIDDIDKFYSIEKDNSVVYPGEKYILIFKINKDDISTQSKGIQIIFGDFKTDVMQLEQAEFYIRKYTKLLK